MKYKTVEMTALCKQIVSEWVLQMSDGHSYRLEHVQNEEIRIRRQCDGETHVEITIQHASLPYELVQSINNGVKLNRLIQEADYIEIKGCDKKTSKIFGYDGLKINEFVMSSGEKYKPDDKYADPDFYTLYITSQNLVNKI